MAAALLVAAVPAQAQTVVKLVDNMQESSSGLAILVLGDQAQAFTTGTNEAGYTLTSIELDYWITPGDKPHSVSLWSVSDGLPDLKIVDLSHPAGFSQGTNVFTAPSGTKLQKDTTYAVVVRGRSGWLRMTGSPNETGDAQAGWSIADVSRRTGISNRGVWQDLLIPSVLNMQVNGIVDGESSDATLSALALQDDGDDTVALSPTPFTPAITEYTAWVADDVNSVTLTATSNDGDASVAITGNGATTTATEATIDLAEGANLLTVTVTAADGDTTRTYTVTVARAAAAPSADSGAIWTANLTVGSGTVSRRPILGDHAANGVGALAPRSFTHDSSTVTVEQFLYQTDSNRPSLRIAGTDTLATGEYVLDVGDKSLSVSHDGQSENIVIDDHGLDWSFGDVVLVKLLIDTTAPQDATLSALDLFDDDGNPLALTPAVFDPATKSYTVSVPHHVNVVELRPTTNRPGATASVAPPAGGAPQPDNAVGHLLVGTNRFTVTVTASNGATTDTYTLTVTRLQRLKARFAGLPASHDGSTGFAVRIHFTDDVSSALANIEAAIEVTNATVSNLERVVGSQSRYTMDVAPSSAAPIRIRMRAPASCSESHAICTADGALFSSNVTRWVSTADDARLQALWVVDGDGDWVSRTPSFDPDTTEYTVWSRIEDVELTLHARGYTPGVTVTVTGGEEPPDVTQRGDGGATAKLRMPPGTSRGRVTVTSADGNVTKSYRFTVLRYQGSGSGTSPATEADQLTVDFENVPSVHDGSSAFTFRIAFSEEVEITPEDMRDHALTVTGATVTDAARVDGRKDLWELTLAPSGSGPVSILTPLERACTEAGALCTADGRALTVGLGVQVLGPPPAPALTVDFENVPSVHDGSSAFTFRIAFSEEVEITPEDMRDHALTVTGATVTAAARVDDRKDLWELTLEPTGSGTVSILTPLQRACTEAGALCTADGRALSNALATTVPGPPPLTAQFVSVPAEHDGETEFWLELTFDAAVEQGSKTGIRALLAVTGGTVKRLRRKDSRLDHWRIKIQPSSHEAVTVTLSPSPPCGATGAVCTPDGRTFTTALATQIQGPPGLTVADAQVQEAANATLAFAVTLSRAPSGTVTVDYATSDGTAAAGSDYTATSGTLTFAAGETEKTVSVPVLDDAHDEGSETLTLTLSNPSGAYLADGSATGTINNSDPMPLAWMVRFGRTVGSQVVDALGQRLDSGTASHVTVGGINLTGEPGAMPETQTNDPFGLPEWATRTQREESAQSLTANELLLRSAFHLSSGSGQGEGPAYTAWGRVARSGFEAEVDDVTMDADVTSGLIGFDAEWERVLAGVMLSQSSGEGSYRLSAENGGRTGTVESSLTGIYPYARLELNAKVSAWALAGMGSGELTLQHDDDKAMPTDITMRMGAVGVKGQVLDGTGPSGLAMNVKSDAMWVGTQSERTADMVATQGDVTRLRVILEGKRAFDMGGGATLTPSAEVGLRHDAGDAETGTGLEMGAGVSYAAGPLTVEGQVRMLVAHEESGYEEWGASGAMRITPSASGRGLTLSIAPEWGRTGSATEQLWSARDATALGTDRVFEGDARLALDAGYGVGVGHGVLTPYAGLTLGDAGRRTVRTGARWQMGAGAVLGLEGTRRTSGTGEAGNELMLRVALRF